MTARPCHDPALASDTAHAIEAGMWDALAAAWKIRERTDLSPAAQAAFIIDAAARAASPSLHRPGLPFSSPDVPRALADALGRWAVAATARSPEFGSPIPACPDEPDEWGPRH